MTIDAEILHKDDVSDVESGIKDISKVIGDRPVSVQVTSNDVQEMLKEAEEFRSWAKNIVVNIPIVNRDGDSCLGVIGKLKSKNMDVSVSGVTSFNQIVMAAKAGGTYLNIFSGHISGDGNDVYKLIERSVAYCERWNTGKVLVESLQGTIDIQSAIIVGTHVVSVPTNLLHKMLGRKHYGDSLHESLNSPNEARNEMRDVTKQIDDLFPDGK